MTEESRYPCWAAIVAPRTSQPPPCFDLRPFTSISLTVRCREAAFPSRLVSCLVPSRTFQPRATATLVCQHRSCPGRCSLARFARPLASSVVGPFAVRFCSGRCCLVTHERVGSGPIAFLFHGPIAAHRSVTFVRPTPGISCEAVPASEVDRRGHEAALLPSNGAAESFVSFIPLFDGRPV